MTSSLRRSGLLVFLALSAALCLSACDQEGIEHGMETQPKYRAFQESRFFADDRSERSLVPGTVAHDHLKTDTLYYDGMVNGQEAKMFPYPVTQAMLERGRERFNIFCAVCHDRTGSGEGMIVRRGFPQPPSYHIDRLRNAPPGHFFNVITNGFGRMFPYADRIPVADRWAIVAYIRALQLSQNAPLADVPPQIRAQLESQSPSSTEPVPEPASTAAASPEAPAP